MSESQIKSSTIMFTDVFGYSRMVGKDEKHALQLLDQHNTIITKSIQEYSGSVVKYIGDSIFAEFAKPEDASKCAIDIQQKFDQRNRIQAKNDRIHIRIGLPMGKHGSKLRYSFFTINLRNIRISPFSTYSDVAKIHRL